MRESGIYIMINKADKLLIFSLGVLALILAAFIYFPKNKEGGVLNITVGGSPFGTYSLADEQEIIINEQGKNVVKIENGKVYMKEADCPDKICVRHTPISKSGEMIVCLPNKVVLEIKSGKAPGADTVAE